jgi:hypothetical protein
MEVPMLKASLISLIVLPLTATCVLAGASQMESGRPQAVLTPEQCGQVWSKAVPSGDSLAAANAQPFVANFQQADADQDGKLSKSEFEAGCGKGLIKFTEH